MQILVVDLEKCPQCGSKHIVLGKHSEIYCKDCGFVIQDQIPINEQSKDPVEAVYINQKKKKMTVVLKGIVQTTLERKMKPFLAEIKKIKIPKYVEAEVLNLCRKAVDLKITMSYSKIELLAALIYIVSRKYNIPILLNDLTKKFDISRKDLLRAAKFVAKKLGLKIYLTDVDSFIIRLASEIGQESLVKDAIKISKRLKISNPVLLASVALWKAGQKKGINLKKTSLAKAAGISVVALRRNLKKTKNNAK